MSEIYQKLFDSFSIWNALQIYSLFLTCGDSASRLPGVALGVSLFEISVIELSFRRCQHWPKRPVSGHPLKIQFSSAHRKDTIDYQKTPTSFNHATLWFLKWRSHPNISLLKALRHTKIQRIRVAAISRDSTLAAISRDSSLVLMVSSPGSMSHEVSIRFIPSSGIAVEGK